MNNIKLSKHHQKARCNKCGNIIYNYEVMLVFDMNHYCKTCGYDELKALEKQLNIISAQLIDLNQEDIALHRLGVKDGI